MKKATFYLENYNFEEFHIINIPTAEGEFSIKIDPSGILNIKENSFLLKLNFQAFNKDSDKAFVSCKLNANYVFSEKINSIEEIPPYFFANSIAIIFPYLRSFLSSLTVQANSTPLILPTMNLGSLSEPLKNNSEIISD